ncbi:MAG: cytochrome C [Burkholderiaceae bacterium]|jgi:hypothetical protein|nr:cytochrome C [Burkholderiaceae bacterium]HMN63820.1 cytochrome C [Burkholderiaceae bacterium]
MKRSSIDIGGAARKLLRLMALGATLALLAAAADPAQALPLFKRQTGQDCSACHAGGQFPELTPYGRLFKLLGYTLGQRTIPLSVMALGSVSRVANTSKSPDPHEDFQKDGSPIFATASLFLGGKLTDHVGGFAQVTYDPYASLGADGSFHGHSNADNIDLRYANTVGDGNRSLVFGLSLNNNPSVADPWNTAAAWMQYVPVPSPTSSRFVDGNAPYPGFAAGGNVAGLSAYAFWNDTLYAELGAYGTSRGLWSFTSAGLAPEDTTQFSGVSPYLRVAWNHDWGAHSLMLGAARMSSRIYDDPLATSDPSTVHRFTDWSVDGQYQYLADANALTAQLVYEHSRHRYPDFLAAQPVAFVDAMGGPLPATNAVDDTNLLRAKLTYVYHAHYGGSIGFFDLTGSTDTALQTSGYDPGTLAIVSDPSAQAASVPVDGNLSGNPGTRGLTYEVFWTPVQNLRVGAQYTAYSRFNGASRNYDGFGRDARDNDTLFLYLWAAY